MSGDSQWLELNQPLVNVTWSPSQNEAFTYLLRDIVVVATQVMSPTDVALVTRLQRRVKELEQEKARMRHDLELDEPGPSGDPEREMYDAIKVRLRPMISETNVIHICFFAE